MADSTAPLNDPKAVTTSAQTAVWRRGLPFAFALLLVAYVLGTVDFDAFVAALSSGTALQLLGFALVWNALLLTADAFATSDVYRRSVCPVRFSELWLIRGASYLPSLLNHHIGQGWITYFLSKVYKAPVWRVAGATLIVYISTFACLVGVAALALPYNHTRFEWLGPLLALIGVGAVGFAAVLLWKPRWLTQKTLLAPILELGLIGHLRAALLRAPHIFVLFLGAWVPLKMYGVHVPFGEALALVPPVLFVAALPITPQGIGARDALSIHLFASYAPGPPEDAAALVAATTLSWVAALVVVQLVCCPWLMRRAYRLLQDRPTQM